MQVIVCGPLFDVAQFGLTSEDLALDETRRQPLFCPAVHHRWRQSEKCRSRRVSSRIQATVKLRVYRVA